MGDVNGKIAGEDRGRQDEAQKATTSVADEALGKKRVVASKVSNGKVAVAKRSR